MLTALRRVAPAAKICFWANNDLFRTYTGAETRAVVGACDCVVCCSDYIAGGIRRKIGTDGGLNKKIRVVLNGVDVGRFSPAQGIPPSGGAPLILFIGRVVKQKGPDLLLRAALALKRRGLDFRVRIVGSGGFSAGFPLTQYEQSLRGIARDLGDRLEFRPFVPREQVPQQLRQASIFCVPSNWDDPCPLAVFEGLACGLPMVVSRRGGIPEQCGDAALYFDPPDSGALAGQLESLIRNPEERRRLGAEARLRAEQSTWAVRYEQLMAALAR
jgi:glycosyltransferase involved in cell wall biosynthesis